MSEYAKGEMTTDGQDSIRIAGTEVAHMCSNFDWTVRRATAQELVRRWNAFEDDGIVNELALAGIDAHQWLGGRLIDDDDDIEYTKQHNALIEKLESAIVKAKPK